MTGNSAGLTRMNIVNELARALPWLEPELRLAMGDEPVNESPLHFTLVPVFSDAFVAALMKPGRNDEELRPFADFLERMATSEDQYVRDLAGTGVIESLLGSGNDLPLAEVRRVMGPTSCAWLDDMAGLR